jgi:hypothetical protein
MLVVVELVFTMQPRHKLAVQAVLEFQVAVVVAQ